MGMMLMLAAIAPGIKIRCALWLLFFIKTIRVPAAILAIWYIGWNIYDLNAVGDKSHINYIAHISGAFSGILLGLLYRWKNPDTINAIRAQY
jgi:membrane associated rhomboid family serine protease